MPDLTPRPPETTAPPQIAKHPWTLARPRQQRRDGNKRIQRGHQLERDVRQRDVDPGPVQAVRVGIPCETDDRR